MAKHRVERRDIYYLAYCNREEGFVHPKYSDDMQQYELIKAGDPRAAEVNTAAFDASVQGRISDDPLRNIKYLFVAAVTLACRAAIAGGVNQQEAYNASDLYIRKMDTLNTIIEVTELHRDMVVFYTEAAAGVKKQHIYSMSVSKAIDYIFDHLNSRITVETAAAAIGLNPSYLSTLFKKETGASFSEYVRHQKVSAACNMLSHSDYTLAEISFALGFSSQSHFTKIMREATGLTPADYRSRHQPGRPSSEENG